MGGCYPRKIHVPGIDGAMLILGGGCATFRPSVMSAGCSPLLSRCHTPRILQVNELYTAHVHDTIVAPLHPSDCFKRYKALIYRQAHLLFDVALCGRNQQDHGSETPGSMAALARTECLSLAPSLTRCDQRDRGGGAGKRLCCGWTRAL